MKNLIGIKGYALLSLSQNETVFDLDVRRLFLTLFFVYPLSLYQKKICLKMSKFSMPRDVMHIEKHFYRNVWMIR